MSDILTADEFQPVRQSFEAYYQDVLYPFLSKKEEIRQRYVTRFIFLILASLVVLPMLAILIYLLHTIYAFDIDWGWFMIPIAIAVYVVRGPYARYDREVKTETMDLIIRFFEGFSYRRGQGLKAQEFAESRIFPPFDEERADDCFWGNYAGVGVRVCEEWLTKVVETKNGSHRTTVFRGIAVELDTDKAFSGQTVVLKDRGFFNKFQSFKDLNNVKLEDVVFEKIFEVYSSDQIEARYLLTTALMERFLVLKKLYGGKKIQASFFKNKLMLAIDTRKNMFEPCSFFKTNLNKKKVTDVFEQILTVLSIIRLLKLRRNAIQA